MIEDVLKVSNTKFKYINAISIGMGPGSLTGIKITSTIVQGLSLGWKVPIIQISSLSTLAIEAYFKHNARFIFSAIDAKTQNIYYNIYKFDEYGNNKLKIRDNLEEINQIKLKKNIIGIGNGCYNYKNILLKNNKSLKIIDNLYYPKAIYNNKLAITEFKNNLLNNPIDLNLKYCDINTYKITTKQLTKNLNS